MKKEDSSKKRGFSQLFSSDNSPKNSGKNSKFSLSKEDSESEEDNLEQIIKKNKKEWSYSGVFIKKISNKKFFK